MKTDFIDHIRFEIKIWERNLKLESVDMAWDLKAEDMEVRLFFPSQYLHYAMLPGLRTSTYIFIKIKYQL
jgi:hypothetical protein